ncbi:hypothetical protein IRZ71_10745 [Flavobacterium sp. ANB]|uniref:hypothetical protein n=1 Tax=unclassified Flavobacterium TaxID=196869 RepID=UPI0012B99282|nr:MULTISPECIES: hypothetical protein [unclassified Flavobacterium]MBF4516827.1 hypothetical protein [Flavobacterium sp. ANB]MTD69277.1 hypothetical protein [Flavobacterium sp. LC2016-13]
MKNSIITLLVIFTFIFNSCNSEKKDQKLNNQKNGNKFIEVIKKQLENGASEEYGSFDDYNGEDLNALVTLEGEILKNDGYVFLSDKDFFEKINLFFKRKIDPNSNSEFLKIDLNNICDKKLDLKPQTADFQYIYVSKKNKFLTYFFAIPQLIDYEKKYPELSVYESKATFITDEVEGAKIEIKRWKNIPDKEKQRQKNIQILINRNKYIFNNNKASLVWLKFNDKEFLESLVKTFGYAQDTDLLKWILDRNLVNASDIDEFSKVLWIKNCNGNIVFHKEIFDVMNVESVNNKKKFIEALKNYLSEFENENLSFSEQAKIKALVCYYGTKLSGSIEVGDVFQFFPFVNGKEYEKEFIKNSYYNLSDFKELYNDAKNGGIWLPGMPE